MPDLVWMPHPAHFICASHCRFHLATAVLGRYIVSTVGEYVPDSAVRRILAESRGKPITERGDAAERQFLREFGFEEIGLGRFYETMVFPARPSHSDDENENCGCAFRPFGWSEIEFVGYNDAAAATEGHYAAVERYLEKAREETTS